MVLFLHSRYRVTGGEERTVEDLLWLVRTRLGERAELLARPSASLRRRDAAIGLLRGGSHPEQVAFAVRDAGVRVVHAHNLHPTLGWRALAAARAAGARVVLHLHQYRLVCAVGVCFTRGAECTRCHGRNTLPGVLRNCRESRAEAALYGVALAAWQQRLLANTDAVIVPSAFARERLRRLGAPVPRDGVHVLAPPVRALEEPEVGPEPERAAGAGGEPPYALVVARLAPEKGVDVAIDACRLASIELRIAGDGPELESLRARAAGAHVRFLGRIGDGALADLRKRASIALVPSRSAESFGLAAAEALAAGVPVAASRVGALEDLVEDDALVEPGDARALADAIARLAGDRESARRGRERARAVCAPAVVAEGLAEIYASVGAAAPTA
jgi:glycosyltransferase involved in cell wall biosynthesis